MKFFKKEFLLPFISIRFIFGAVILTAFLAIYWQWLAYQAFLVTPINITNIESSKSQTIGSESTENQESQNRTIENNRSSLVINKGDNINLLARRWQTQGLISNQYYLRLLCFFYPEYKNIKAGEYLLMPSETPHSLLTKLILGKTIQYPFTIIEGMNQFEVIKLVEQNNFLYDDIELVELINDLDIPLSNNEKNIEGWLYPDTYHFSKNESAIKLLKRAVSKMKLILDEEWQARAPNLPYKNSYEALIMASIIEKETGISDERDKIAGVFVRRLQKRMRLGTDPTVIYGIGPEFNGDITYKDLRTATPYNTYIIKGLPPTPISMPGRESIHAALHPADGEELYFVADGSGGHYFSRSLEEHNRAVKRYLSRNK